MTDIIKYAFESANAYYLLSIIVLLVIVGVPLLMFWGDKLNKLRIIIGKVFGGDCE